MEVRDIYILSKILLREGMLNLKINLRITLIQCWAIVLLFRSSVYSVGKGTLFDKFYLVRLAFRATWQCVGLYALAFNFMILFLSFQVYNYQVLIKQQSIKA